jgi:hypothetical protein
LVGQAPKSDSDLLVNVAEVIGREGHRGPKWPGANLRSQPPAKFGGDGWVGIVVSTSRSPTNWD